MSDYRVMTMKFPNSCAICGKKIDAGAGAYGAKNDTTGKWSFVCSKRCLDKQTSRERIKSPPIITSIFDNRENDSIESLLDVIESVEAGVVSDSILEMITDNNPMTNMPSVKKERPMTALELIRKNAVYGGL